MALSHMGMILLGVVCKLQQQVIILKIASGMFCEFNGCRGQKY